MDSKQNQIDVVLSRGKLAKLTDTNIETVRYYERMGLLPEPPRSNGGHRQYQSKHVKRLSFIRRSRELGFTLEQVRGLLRFADTSDFSCSDVKSMTLEHRDEVRQKISDLKKIERVLEQMADQCEGGQVPECPIIDALFHQSSRAR